MDSSHISDSEINLFQSKILNWFTMHGRHGLPWRQLALSTYQIVIAEVLLQRTKAETISKYYQGFIKNFPGWEEINRSDITYLEEFLRPIGLYRQRAKRLKDLASNMVKRKGQFPEERSNLEQIPFLGQYIVNAILLQIFKKRTPLLDVNMSRVLERYFGERKLSDIRYDPYLQDLAYKVVNHPESININWAILDFGALVCTAKLPHCQTCLLSTTCVFVKKILP